MKRILSIATFTVVFAACNSNPKTTANPAPSVTAADTATTNHNAFSDKAQEVKLNGVSDTIVGNDGNTYVKVKPKEAEAVPVVKETAPVRHTPARATRTRAVKSGTVKSESSTVSKSTPVSDSTNTTATTTTTTTTTTAPKKKGWSKAAKGAVIGAGSGAVAGAIISKKKGTGAIIGGIIGGAGGYIIGKGKDKKDGRNNTDTNNNQ